MHGARADSKTAAVVQQTLGAAVEVAMAGVVLHMMAGVVRMAQRLTLCAMASAASREEAIPVRLSILMSHSWPPTETAPLGFVLFCFVLQLSVEATVSLLTVAETDSVPPTLADTTLEVEGQVQDLATATTSEVLVPSHHRLGTPEDVGALTAFLASLSSSFVNGSAIYGKCEEAMMDPPF
eukprot:SAG31_NODE_435_length_15733_cov_6.508251_21_plen_181_part_00